MLRLFPIICIDEYLSGPKKDLFDELSERFSLLNMLDEGKQWTPAVDIYDNDKEIVVKAEIPGMDKKDIDITLSDGLLTLRGEKKEKVEDKNENCHRIETYYGSFSRTLRVPIEVEVDKVNASYKDGVLKIKIPKSEYAETKKIEIKD